MVAHIQFIILLYQGHGHKRLISFDFSNSWTLDGTDAFLFREVKKDKHYQLYKVFYKIF